MSKVVQIAALKADMDGGESLYALTSDGKIFLGDWELGTFTWRYDITPPEDMDLSWRAEVES